jgi:hypothetical protein
MLEGSATPGDINAIVRLAHALAKASLFRKKHVQMLVDRHGLDIGDLAFDCIADLFARDGQGRLLALESYFAAVELDKLTNDEVIVELQRLVFSKVKHGIFRLYREIDPQLGKILRNITAAVQAFSQFDNVLRLGEPCLVPVASDSLEEMPALDAEQITDHLRACAKGSEFVPTLLGKIALFLRKQNENSRVVPVVTVALAIRSFYAQKQLVEAGEPVTTINTNHDVQALIEGVCRQTKARLTPKFVTRQRIPADVFNLYFKVIEQCLIARLVNQDGEGLSYTGCLMSHMPSLSVEDCKRNHKNRLEYLARVVNNAVAKELAL